MYHSIVQLILLRVSVSRSLLQQTLNVLIHVQKQAEGKLICSVRATFKLEPKGLATLICRRTPYPRSNPHFVSLLLLPV